MHANLVILLLALAIGLQPVSTDLYLPGLPGLAKDLHASVAMVQYTLTGLLLAFELVSNRQTMAPLPVAMNAHAELVEDAYSRGLIIYSRRTRGGLEGDHFMICPPLTVSDSEIAEILDGLDSSLQAFSSRHGLLFEAVS